MSGRPVGEVFACGIEIYFFRLVQKVAFKGQALNVFWCWSSWVRWQVSRLLLCSGEAQVWVGLRVLWCSWGSSGLQNLDMKLVGSDQWAQMRKPKKLLSSWILFLSASKINNYWLENTLEHWGCEKSFIKADLLLINFSIVNINIQLQTVTKIVL